MVSWFQSLFRYFQVRHLARILLANLCCFVPFAAALALPLLVPGLGWGTVALCAGFLVTGQALALSGRLLDVRFRGDKPIGFWGAWRRAWAEGLAVGLVLIVLFSLVFRSVPYYWAQETVFARFSLAVLGVGGLFFLGGLPFYLPVRRRENLGLFAAAARAFRLMNEHPLLALACGLFSVLSVIASAGTLGLFPGWAGLGALHQGVYDRAVEKSVKS